MPNISFAYMFEGIELTISAYVYVGNGQPDDPDEFGIEEAMLPNGDTLDVNSLDRDDVYEKAIEALSDDFSNEWDE